LVSEANYQKIDGYKSVRMMNNLKILWFNWRCWFNPAMGGAEVFTYEVAKRLVASGNEVCLFTSQFQGCLKEEVVDGVRIVRSGGRFSVYRKAKEFYFKRFRAEGFDIVIDEINTRPFFASEFVSGNEKVVALIHQLAREYWFYETPFPLSYIGYYFLEDRWLKRCVNVPTVTVSESTRKDLLDLGFKHVSVVPEGLNFTPLSDFSQKNLEPVIMFAGRLKRAKRPDHALEAFKIVKDKLPNVEMWIFGDGPFRKELEEKFAISGVRFFGCLPSLERRDLIKKGWLLVNPSIREGWGLNVIEANALGVPCVGYDVPGLRDSIKNGETGVLVASGDICRLAENVLRILQNSDEYRGYAFNALKYSNNFSWEKTVLAFSKFLINSRS